ncbi:hypothetical protein BSP38_241 [Bacillus phage BSP38]|uniref:Uncharacterized protein n=1 Tax=Bacillus phage BSP38 TaxID=2283013 RepID=A0A345MKA1_BPBSP|nr:hypothetical protein HWB82_gp077 [Bacillus phage BSP38]AXH71283.1 hypothetical protein BSP38_241 [Bacillus phage BSP38]
MPINLNIRKNEADKPKVQEIEDGYFVKIDDGVFVVKMLSGDSVPENREVALVDLGTFLVFKYKSMSDLKKRLSINDGRTVEVIRPKQANVNIGFEWRDAK